MSLIAPLLQQRGVDPNVLLAMKGNNGFGNGDGSWFIWLLFILCFCGWGGNGFGFGGRGNGAGLANEINNDYGRSLLMDAIGGNRNALSNLATQLNCTEGQIQQAISALTTKVQNVGNQVGINNVAVGQERGFSSVAFETKGQTCDILNAIKDSTQTVVNGQRQAELRDMQDKIDHLREENGTYKSSAMTSQIVGQAIAPVNAMLAGLQKEVDGIKCKLPSTVTTSYSPFTAVPNCVAWQTGLYGLNGVNNASFWG